MATPTLGMTFNDLILHVAEFLGVADYTSSSAAVPTDVHDLDMCKRIVNDGYARFIGEYPWTFLNVSMTITGDNTNNTFDLPDDFQGEFLTTFTYPTTGPIAYTKQTTEEHIRILRAGRVVTGYPSLFAIQPNSSVTETTTTGRWQVVFWPTPPIVVLTARYRRFPNKLTNLTDRSVAGPQHDQAAKQACVAAAEIQRYGEMGPQETLYQTYLAASIKRDVRNVPRTLGYNGDASDDSRGCAGHWPGGPQVDQYNGTSVLD